MSDAFTFTLDGHAQGKERARVVNGRAFTPRRTAAYETALSWACRAARPRGWQLDGRYHVHVDIVERTGKGGRRGVAPDCDNVLKAVCDGIEGVAFENDRAVDGVSAWRRAPVTPSEPARVVVTVRRLA